MATDQEKWRADGKELRVEMVPTASQTNHTAKKVKDEVAEVATQIEVEMEVLERVMERKKEEKTARIW